MNTLQYIGFDVHKKSISYCVKVGDGTVMAEGKIRARREELTAWAQGQPQPWVGALEATLFTGWIYDHLRPYAQQIRVGHPAMMRAITAAKKKNDQVDAQKIADLLRCDLLPECYIAPQPLRELRRVLRYRNLVVRQAVSMGNRLSGLLMETGTPYHQRRLWGRRYYEQLLTTLEVPESVRELLQLSRSSWEMFQGMQKRLLRELLAHPQLQARVERLQSIPGVGVVTALTWALEVGEPSRFTSIAQACSYAGLTPAQRQSADREHRGPISKQRNRHLQTVLIEAAKLAPRWNPQLAAVHDRALQRGNRNRATLVVARKLVAYLLAVDRSGRAFQLRTQPGS